MHLALCQITGFKAEVIGIYFFYINYSADRGEISYVWHLYSSVIIDRFG